jgi:hypothetical protein
MNLFEARKGATAKAGKGTATQRLYRQWLAGEDQAGVVNALTNICSRACSPLCLPVDSTNPLAMARRLSSRWPWCKDFVVQELRDASPYAADPDCRYIARRCRQRFIDEIRRGTAARFRYGVDRVRDARGRFIR